MTKPPSVFQYGNIAILLLGLLAAASASTFAYRAAGPYANGFLNFGVTRTVDPRTEQPVLVRDVARADGGTVRYFFDMGTRKLTGTRVLPPGAARPGDMVPPSEAPSAGTPGIAKGGVKTGFSLAGNGVIDAWEYRDAAGRLERIEVSRRQDGNVDRWEHYDAGQLARAEEDNDHDGRVDHWLDYEVGILIGEAFDRDGDGRRDESK